MFLDICITFEIKAIIMIYKCNNNNNNTNNSEKKYIRDLYKFSGIYIYCREKL